MAAAQASIGTFYANGQGVRQDRREATRWWRLAAEQIRPGYHGYRCIKLEAAPAQPLVALGVNPQGQGRRDSPRQNS